MNKVLAVITAAGVLGGCAGPQINATGAGIETGNAVHDVARQDGDSYESAFKTVHPTNVVVDSGGANVQTGGPNTVLGILLGENQQLFTSNPADTSFERLTYTSPDGGIVEVEGFVSQKSVVIASWNEQAIQNAVLQGQIAEHQAEIVRSLVAAGMNVFDAVRLIGG